MPIVAARTTLPPPQRAYAAYASHFTACSDCRDVDVPSCVVAEGLYRTWRQAHDAAFEQLTAQSVPPTA